MAKKQRASLLCRVSTKEQHRHMNLERQVETLLKKATEDGYVVPEELIFQEQITGDDGDLALRGTIVEQRKAIQSGKVDVVYIVDITRVSRNPYNVIQRMKWFTDNKIPVYIEDVELWTLFPDSKEENKEATDYIFAHATYGQKELEKMKKRTKKGRDALARGGWYVGHLSDGYVTEQIGTRKKIIIDNNRANVIKRIFDLYINGKSTDEIASILNSENIPTTNKYRVISNYFNYPEKYKRKGIEYNRNNLKWQGVQISQILNNEWYRGKRTYNGSVYDIDALVSEEIWNQAKEIKSQRNQQFRSIRKKRIHAYLLSNYFYCGKCGSKMYGHFTGLNNHYYCSSYDEGKKCGLRGINKENIEAIISHILKYRAINELLKVGKGMVSNFFMISEEERNEIKKEIKIKQREILDRRKSIDELIKKATILYSHLGDENLDEKILKSVIEDNRKEQNRINEEIILKDSEIKILEKRLKFGENIKKIIDNIEQLDNINTLRKLIEKTIYKIEIYNVDKSITFIKIIYLNNKEDSFLYSYKLLGNHYIFFENNSYEHFNIQLDLTTSKFLIEDNYLLFFNNYSYGTIGKDAINLYNLSKEELNTVSSNKEFDYFEGKTVYSKSISLREFLLEIRKIPSFLYEFDNTPFIEVNDERSHMQKDKYKEWRKKYNNGLPTCLPYVVKDDNYENYIKKRKHLYNRKFKIKKNKSLTNSQKNEELSKIDKELSLLRVKVKYLTREEAIKTYQGK